MSYTINVSGGGARIAAARDAFAGLIRALDAATPEGESKAVGSIGGFEGDEGYSLSASEVRDEDSDAERTATSDAAFDAARTAEAQA